MIPFANLTVYYNSSTHNNVINSLILETITVIRCTTEKKIQPDQLNKQ